MKKFFSDMFDYEWFFKNFVLVIFVLSVYIAVYVDYNVLTKIVELRNTKEIISGICFPKNVVTTISIVTIFIAYKKYFCNIRPVVSLKVSGVFFALAMYAGICFSGIGTMFPYMKNKVCIVIIILYLCGWYFVWSYCLQRIVDYLSIYKSEFIEKTIRDLSCRQFYIYSFLFIFVLWSPYILIRLPAGMEWDAKQQILQFLGYAEWDTHWPVFSTMLMGSFVKLGGYIGSYTSGLIGFVLFQFVVSVGILAYSVLYLKQHRIKSIWIFLLLILYSVIPLFPGYLTSVVKDALFADSVLLFVILFKQLLDKELHKYGKTFLAIITLLMCMLRNNGVHIVTFVFAIYLIGVLIESKSKNSKYILGCFGSVILIYSAYWFSLTPIFGIKQWNIPESLSIPFQQTARYLKYYPNDITNDERNVIGEVLDVNAISEMYNPLLSDKVRCSYHGNISSLKNYFCVWGKMFLRHPLVYIDATIHNCYGFFDVNSKMFKGHGLNSSIYEDAITYDYINNKVLPLYLEFPNLNKHIKGLRRYVAFIEANPITFVMCTAGFWLCLSIALLVESFKHKNLFFVNIPNVVGILVCVASPTFAHNGLRYALPIILTAPFLLCLTFGESKNENNSGTNPML